MIGYLWYVGFCMHKFDKYWAKCYNIKIVMQNFQNILYMEEVKFMTQLDLKRVRQSISNQIGSKIKISANRGRHKFVTAKGVITQTYPNIFLVELEDTDGSDQNKTVSFSYQDVITRDVRMMLLEN